MSEAIAINIRKYRDALRWTQKQLAQAAGLSIQTVQRAEAGESISAASLQAIAAAIRVSVEDLRFDLHAVLTEAFGESEDGVFTVYPEPRPDEAAARRLAKTSSVLPLTRVETSDDLLCVLDAETHHFESTATSQAAIDLSDKLRQRLDDVVKSPPSFSVFEQRRTARVLFELVEALAAAGCVLSLGLQEELGDGGLPRAVLYAIVSPRGQPVDCVWVLRNPPHPA